MKPIFDKRPKKFYKRRNNRPDRRLQQRDAFPRIVEEIQTLIAGTKTRVLGSLEKKVQSSTDAETSDVFLREHVGSSLKLVVLYADLVGSTLMTKNLSVDKLATIIQIFTQEMSFVVASSGGKVLKFVGDAIIAYFPVDVNYSLACNAAIDCSYSMIIILEKAINPVISVHGYDGLRLKVGIDTSDHSVIQYLIGEKSYLDILGYGVSMAAKLSSLAKSDVVIISHAIYTGMHSSLRKTFSELELDPRIWKYIDERFQPGVWKSHP
jgi:adenylate cyclase